MAIGTGTAILASSLIGAGSSYFGARGANDAAQNNAAAAAANADAANQQIYQYNNQANDYRYAGAADMGNWLTRGYDATRGAFDPMADQFAPGVSMMYGARNVNGGWQDFDPGNYTQSPGYQHILKEGVNTLQNSAAAGGNLYHGNTGREIVDYASGVAAQDYDNWYNRQLDRAQFDSGQETMRYGADLANRDFGYQRGRDLVNIGSGGIQGQYGIDANYYGNMANVRGDLYGNLATDAQNTGSRIANVYTGNAATQANTPYASPWGGINQAVQGGIQNWFEYGGGGGNPQAASAGSYSHVFDPIFGGSPKPNYGRVDFQGRPITG